MNILFLTNVYPSPIEPTKGVFNYHLAQALAREHKVTVINPISWVDELLRKPKGTQLPSHLVKGINERVRVHYPRYYYPPGILRSRYGWFYWQSVRSVVRRVMNTDAPDVILSFWVHPDGEAGVRAARERGIPSVMVVGGSDVLVLTQQAARRNCVAKVLRSADAVITVSADLANKVRDFGVCSDKVHLWARGIEASVFSPGDRLMARHRIGFPTSTPMLLWIGRMVPVKGIDVLLDACAILKQRLLDFQLCLVGDGPLRSILENKCRSLDLNGTVSFVGTRLHDQLPDWYRAADLTVLPSHSEGLPNVLRESLACGTPFVASRVGGIPEIAQEPWDRLVPPNDPAALANAIASALTTPTVEPRPSTASMSWADSADALIRILEPLVRRPTSRRSFTREVHACVS
jgi:teichuronic acid biosynthesis glycosyltransferase TuaC